MTDMKKVYNDLTITNLYTTEWPSLALNFCLQKTILVINRYHKLDMTKMCFSYKIHKYYYQILKISNVKYTTISNIYIFFIFSLRRSNIFACSFNQILYPRHTFLKKSTLQQKCIQKWGETYASRGL